MCGIVSKINLYSVDVVFFVVIKSAYYTTAVPNPWAAGSVELGRGPYNIDITNVYI